MKKLFMIALLMAGPACAQDCPGHITANDYDLYDQNASGYQVDDAPGFKFTCVSPTYCAVIELPDGS